MLAALSFYFSFLLSVVAYIATFWTHSNQWQFFMYFLFFTHITFLRQTVERTTTTYRAATSSLSAGQRIRTKSDRFGV
jgi:hypothetical protein